MFILRLFNKLEDAMQFLANLSIILMMLLISANTIGRMVFNSPLPGTHDIASLLLMVAIVYLGLSATAKNNKHVSVETIVNKLPIKIQKITKLLTNLLIILFFVFLFYQSFLLTYDAFINNKYHYGSITFPMYFAYIFLPLGSLFMIIRTIINSVNIFIQNTIDQS